MKHTILFMAMLVFLGGAIWPADTPVPDKQGTYKTADTELCIDCKLVLQEQIVPAASVQLYSYASPVTADMLTLDIVELPDTRSTVQKRMPDNLLQANLIYRRIDTHYDPSIVALAMNWTDKDNFLVVTDQRSKEEGGACPSYGRDRLSPGYAIASVLLPSDCPYASLSQKG